MADPNPLRPLDLLLEAAAIQILAPVPAILTPSTSSTSSGGYSDPPPSPLDPPVRKRKWLDVVLNDSNVNVDPLVVFGPGVAWFSDAASARLPTPLVPAPAPAPVPTARNRQFTWVAVTPTSGNVSTPSDTAPAAAAPFRPAARAIAAASSVVAKARTAYPSPPTQHITTPMAPPALALPAQELGQLTEAQTRKVVEHLAVVLSEAKKDVLERLQQMDDESSLPALPEINRLLLQNSAISSSTAASSSAADTSQPIHSPSHLRALFSRQYISIPPHEQTFYHVIDFYALTTAFMSVYQMFFEVLVTDMLGDVIAAPSSLGQPAMFKKLIFDFLSCLDDADNFLLSGKTDPYMWHYHAIHHTTSTSSSLPLLLRHLLHSSSLRFNTLTSAETILSTFYTEHLLEVAAQRHQKDHGQFYTPSAVVRFMWDRCLDSATLLDPLLAYLRYPIDLSVSDLVPTALDPCMGIGSFLCEYVTRVTSLAYSQPLIWSSPQALSLLLRSLCASLWGVEIDAHALRLGRINLVVHLLPLYRRLLELHPSPLTLKLPRLRLFRNDTLLLALPPPGPEMEWERAHLTLLRDPSRMKFRYVVTNPPYMIRKTGFVARPDPQVCDERVLGGRGTQAYMYFLWVCLQRVEEELGKVCLVTPSQWIVLEFAEGLRSWIWDNCHLEEFYQFEPFKIWPKIQTDSLIFKLRRRQNPLSSTLVPSSHVSPPTPITFLRHTNRKSSLDSILRAYSHQIAHPSHHSPSIFLKITPPPPDTPLPPTSRLSFAFITPTSSVADRLRDLTASLPRLCDFDSTARDPRSPLVWHRGPNTHPVYALVVRTRWAREQFGEETCRKWLRPVFYWNGKSDPRGGGGAGTASKESQFWHGRDALRLTRKEASPAEAYVPFRGAVEGEDQDGFYSLIMVDREGAERLRTEEGEEGKLWRYLKEARQVLQPEKVEREVAWCHFNQCGVNVPVKIVHPINFGYFTKSQPRQRFFLDTSRRCVTNQCIYFTVKPPTDLPPTLPPHPSHLFFLGLLNSTTLQHLITTHCSYDQQGRTRFFGKKMAGIPYAPPPLNGHDTAAMEVLVSRTLEVRGIVVRIAGIIGQRTVAEKMRKGMWRLEEGEIEAAGRWGERRRREVCGRADVPPFRLADALTAILAASSLLQHTVDQFTYRLYGVAPDLQIALEEDLGIEVVPEWANAYPREEDVGVGAPCMPSWGWLVVHKAEEAVVGAKRVLEGSGE